MKTYIQAGTSGITVEITVLRKLNTDYTLDYNSLSDSEKTIYDNFSSTFMSNSRVKLINTPFESEITRFTSDSIDETPVELNYDLMSTEDKTLYNNFLNLR